MGVSKKIKCIPRHFELGKTWVFLAHNKALEDTPGIFYAFRPIRVDLVINDPQNIPDKAKKIVDKLGDKKARLVVVEKEE